MNTMQQEIHAVLFERSPGEWVGQCLQFDIGAQAGDITDLVYELQRAIVGHIVIAIENGVEPFESLSPAPQMYWDMWEQASETFQPLELSCSPTSQTDPSPR